MLLKRIFLLLLCFPLSAQSEAAESEAPQLEEAIHSIRKKVDDYLLQQDYQAAIEQLESFRKRFPDNTHFDELLLSLQKLYQVQQLDPSQSPPKKQDTAAPASPMLASEPNPPQFEFSLTAAGGSNSMAPQ